MRMDNLEDIAFALNYTIAITWKKETLYRILSRLKDTIIINVIMKFTNAIHGFIAIVPAVIFAIAFQSLWYAFVILTRKFMISTLTI